MSIDTFDVTVSPLTVDGAVDAIIAAASGTSATLIAAHNLHSVYVLHTNDAFRRFYDSADYTLIDGWPILSALNRTRSRSGLPKLGTEFRIGSTDWIPEAIRSEHISRVLVVGASRESNEGFIRRASTDNRGIEFLGIPGHPWRPHRLPELVEEAKEFGPQLTIVGMGMPLQEEVALALRSGGVMGAIATVGGAIDQLSGAQGHAPRWTGRLKIEWLWRLACDPRRLASRYLVEPLDLLRVLYRRKRAIQ
ncbi:WecB/TagA/CpsF family glycosyltransferase [Microbacterium sp. zg.Y625]|uniref:WecB/TagA/CpsF family glycosyltransferase n=1 Tax=Microbacterium jiangjiandongii TaxID=3049071 RepID=UPI00214CDB32|nr:MULTISPECIES: WecB/TagA/CpsF family glycosyltransferase [unclassified Microbacterium]MCR2793527.1 WecB/TagA/CpsF family glycosyltransferase [Microbacterium sp. zg.Y625]WIM25881.1 WecB/TagA/CpsF family glycosyltransferase [Microbacterium sp. zg-Y625]